MKISVVQFDYINTKLLQKELSYSIAEARATGKEAVIVRPSSVNFDKFEKAINNYLKLLKKSGRIELYLF